MSNIPKAASSAHMLRRTAVLAALPMLPTEPPPAPPPEPGPAPPPPPEPAPPAPPPQEPGRKSSHLPVLIVQVVVDCPPIVEVTHSTLDPRGSIMVIGSSAPYVYRFSDCGSPIDPAKLSGDENLPRRFTYWRITA